MHDCDRALETDQGGPLPQVSVGWSWESLVGEHESGSRWAKWGLWTSDTFSPYGNHSLLLKLAEATFELIGFHIKLIWAKDPILYLCIHHSTRDNVGHRVSAYSLIFKFVLCYIISHREKKSSKELKLKRCYEALTSLLQILIFLIFWGFNWERTFWKEKHSSSYFIFINIFLYYDIAFIDLAIPTIYLWSIIHEQESWSKYDINTKIKVKMCQRFY